MGARVAFPANIDLATLDSASGFGPARSDAVTSVIAGVTAFASAPISTRSFIAFIA